MKPADAKKRKAAARRAKSATKPPARELTGMDLPANTVKLNGVEIQQGATVAQGDTLTISIPSWPGFWLKSDAYGATTSAFQTPYANGGVYSLKVTLPVGDRYYEFEKADGTLYFAFKVNVVAPKPAEQPEIVVGPTYVDLPTQKLEVGKTYDLRPGTHNVAGIKPPDGCTLIGHDTLIQVLGGNDAWCGFYLTGTEGVTLRGITFNCLARQVGALADGGCRDLTLDALKCRDRSGSIAQVTGDPTNQTGYSSNVTLTGDWTGGLTDKYGFFGNNIRGLKIRSATMPSPTYETGIRLHEGIEDLDIDGLTLDTRTGIAFNDAANAAAKAAGNAPVFGKLPVAGRFHAGTRWTINNLRWWGVLGFGPMTRDNGGDSLPDGPERTRVLGLRCTNVRASNLVGVGMLELNPGLSDAIFDTGSIDAPTAIGSMTFIGPFSVFEQQYPHTDRAHPGDPIRPAAVASFLRFALTNASTTGVGFDRATFPGVTFPTGSTINGKALA